MGSPFANYVDAIAPAKKEEKSQSSSPFGVYTEVEAPKEKPGLFEKAKSYIGDIASETAQEFRERPIAALPELLAQPALGLAQKFTYPVDLLAAQAMIESEQELDELERNWNTIRMLSPERDKLPEEFPRELYEKQIAQAPSKLPTQRSFEESVDRQFGTRISPNTRLKQLLRLGGFTGGMAREGTRKLTAAGTPALSAGLEVAGNFTPEQADVASSLAMLLPQLYNAPASSSRPQQIPGLPAAEGPITPSAVSASEEAAQFLQGRAQGQKPQVKLPPGTPENVPKPQPLPTAQQARRIEARPTDSPISIRPETALEPTQGNQFLDVVYPQRFRNSYEGGQALLSTLREADQAAYQGVRQLYDRSRELNANQVSIFENLVPALQESIEELENIIAPNEITRNMLQTQRQILNRVAELSEEGEVIGYRPVSNQQLIDQIQEINQAKAQYNFEHGVKKNRFMQTNDLLNDALFADLDSSALSAGNREALQANQQARAAYREWANTFDNDTIRPFRNLQNRDVAKAYQGALEVDDIVLFEDLFQGNQAGEQVVNGLKRDLVEKKLGDKFEERSVTPRKFQRELDELAPILTEEQYNRILEDYNAGYRQRQREAALTKDRIKVPEIEKTRELEIAAKYTDKPIAKIRKEMADLEGLRQLEKDLSDTASGREIFKRLKEEQTKRMLQNNRVKGTPTQQELFKILNNQDNLELFREMWGDQVDNILEQLDRTSNKEVRWNNVRKNVKKKVATGLFLKLLMGM